MAWRFILKTGVIHRILNTLLLSGVQLGDEKQPFVYLPAVNVPSLMPMSKSMPTKSKAAVSKLSEADDGASPSPSELLGGWEHQWVVPSRLLVHRWSAQTAAFVCRGDVQPNDGEAAVSASALGGDPAVGARVVPGTLGALPDMHLLNAPLEPDEATRTLPVVIASALGNQPLLHRYIALALNRVHFSIKFE